MRNATHVAPQSKENGVQKLLTSCVRLIAASIMPVTMIKTSVYLEKCISFYEW